MNNIDLVYLWVNGNDPAWRAKRNAVIGCPTDRQENCKGRTADNGELKYSLRSVEKYAPWIRNIIIVTDHQKPEWLNTDNPKVRIVDLEDIMPADCLPCFNSALIEQFLHNVPELSEHFLYANDDMMINREVNPGMFFAEDGMPYVYLRRKYFRKKFLWFRERVMKKTLTCYGQTIRNAALLVDRSYGVYYGGKPHHNIDAYLKTTLHSLYVKFEDDLAEMRTRRMRSPRDIQRIFFSYAALAEKMAHLRYVTKKHSFQLEISKRKQYREFEKYNPVFFCMNDNERASDDDRRYATEYLCRMFPDKSQFEK